MYAMPAAPSHHLTRDLAHSVGEATKTLTAEDWCRATRWLGTYDNGPPADHSVRRLAADLALFEPDERGYMALDRAVLSGDIRACDGVITALASPEFAVIRVRACGAGIVGWDLLRQRLTRFAHLGMSVNAGEIIACRSVVVLPLGRVPAGPVLVLTEDGARDVLRRAWTGQRTPIAASAYRSAIE